MFSLSTSDSSTPLPRQLAPGRYELQCPDVAFIPGHSRTTIDIGVSVTLDKGMKLALRSASIDIEPHDIHESGPVDIVVKNNQKTPIHVERYQPIAIATVVRSTFSRRRSELGWD